MSHPISELSNLQCTSLGSAAQHSISSALERETQVKWSERGVEQRAVSNLTTIVLWQVIVLEQGREVFRNVNHQPVHIAECAVCLTSVQNALLEVYTAVHSACAVQRIMAAEGSEKGQIIVEAGKYDPGGHCGHCTTTCFALTSCVER